MGTESTFRDISSKTELREKLRHTAEELEKDLARTQFKGRTLVLKIKLHTYEVFTRQIAPPKAVSSADDLYDYSLPMLAKLEKDMPAMKLRLMGLRCTHLVSTKKPDGNEFFNSRPRPTAKLRHRGSSGSLANASHDDTLDQWEIWPDSEFEEAARQERAEEMDQLNRFSQEALDLAESRAETADFHEPFGRYKHGNLPNAAPKVAPPPPDEFWDCPICLRPQNANDREFNDHIDFCLSRQTIKEAVTEVGDVEAAAPTTTLQEAELPGRPSTSTAKRKAASEVGRQGDRRQKRLFFT